MHRPVTEIDTDISRLDEDVRGANQLTPVDHQLLSKLHKDLSELWAERGAADAARATPPAT